MNDKNFDNQNAPDSTDRLETASLEESVFGDSAPLTFDDFDAATTVPAAPVTPVVPLAPIPSPEPLVPELPAAADEPPVPELPAAADEPLVPEIPVVADATQAAADVQSEATPQPAAIEDTPLFDPVTGKPLFPDSEERAKALYGTRTGFPSRGRRD